VLATLPVRFFLDNGVPAKTKAEEVVLRLVEARGVRYLNADARDLALGDAKLRIIPPVPGVGDGGQNNISVGVVVERGRFKALFTGDSEVELLSAWLEHGVLPDVDVLKAAHHGSHNGVTPRFLAAVRPEVVVISCGAGNSYGHPHAEALRQYESGGRAVLRTDRNGEVVVRVAPDGAYKVEAERGIVPEHAPASTPAPAPTEPPSAAAPAETHASEPTAGTPTPVPATPESAPSAVAPPDHAAVSPPASPAPTPGCCRMCKRGRACGDVCVPRSHPCTKTKGCACDAQ